MSQKTVIIIGAGLAGLSTGIYSQINGFKSQIFEHANKPGGVAATWKRKGFTIDGGIHFYMGYLPGFPDHNLYRELGVYQSEQYQEISTYARFLNTNTARHLDVTSDLDRLSHDLKAISPDDAKFIDKFIRGSKALSGSNLYETMPKPPELTTWWDRIRMMAKMGKTIQYYSGFYMRPVKEAVKDLHDPWLRWILEHMFLPEVPLVFVMMLLGLLKDKNLAVRKDGSAGFSQALEKRYKDLGGNITYKAAVEEIMVENDRAVGVRLENGKAYRADRIISAGDGHSTIFKLLKGHYVSKHLKEIYIKWPLFRPLVMIHYGVSHEFRDEPSIHVFKPKQEISNGFPAGDWLSVKIFNYSRNFGPEERTLIQVMVESTWEPWRDIRENIEAYKLEKEKVAAQVLNRLDDVWPGVSGTVEMTNVATPYTWWRYTRNQKGAYEGFAITGKSLTGQVNRTLPGLKNFYMAGQWTVPGGGVLPSLLTGRHAGMLLCHQEGKKFRAGFA